MSARDRKLDTLVFADRHTEHLALRGIVARAVDEPARVADTLGGDQDSFRVHAVENVAEALAFLADQVGGRHPQVVEEQFGGGMVQHGCERFDGETLADRVTQVDQQHRHAPAGLVDRIARRGAHQQQQQVGMLDARDEYLLTVDDEIVAVALRASLDARGVGAGRRLGDAESLQAQPAGGDVGQIFLLLLLAAMA